MDDLLMLLDQKNYFFNKHITCARSHDGDDDDDDREKKYDKLCGNNYEARCDGFRTRLANKVLDDYNNEQEEERRKEEERL
jgi:hypothetical protein